MRRHQVKDYQNPQKSNRFSPSPIKRYQTSKSFTLSNPVPDNKENLGMAQAFSKPGSVIGVRQKKIPLQVSQQYFTQPNNNKILESLTKHKGDQENSNTMKSNKIPADAINEFEQKENTTSIKNKRNDKLLRKNNETSHNFLKSVPLETLSMSHDLGVNKSERNSSRKEKISSINNNQEIDSLMEGTYNSDEHSSGPSGVQYQGRWTNEEHQKFIEGLKMFGKDWRKIEDYIGSRTCAQIRSHAQKYFNRIQREVAKGKRKEDPTLQMMKKNKPAPQQPEVVPQITQKEFPIQAQTNQQIQQIHQTLQKIAEDDFIISLRQLISQREQICLEVLLKRSSQEIACEKLIQITNNFHQMAMQALNACKFEICNRMIDERNLTQFVCILFSKQVTIEPVDDLKNQEILQHVQLTPVGDKCQSPIDNSQHFTHERETARSSPHGISNIKNKSGLQDIGQEQLQ